MSKETRNDCWPWSHKWSKWETFSRPIIYDGKQCLVEAQKRKCSICGIEKRRELDD